jgi:Holliday junction resolvase RusA-like endonuclease
MWSNKDGKAYNSAIKKLTAYMQRVRSSFGKMHVNDGVLKTIDETTPYQIDYTRQFYLFDIIPMGAVRMTQSDKWKTDPNHEDINKRQRECVRQYFAYKSALIAQSNMMNFEVDSCLDILFLIPMPASWTDKKKKDMNGMPCKVKPDTDNLIKGFKDALCKNDSYIWKEQSEKRWAYSGSIIVFK